MGTNMRNILSVKLKPIEVMIRRLRTIILLKVIILCTISSFRLKPIH